MNYLFCFQLTTLWLLCICEARLSIPKVFAVIEIPCCNFSRPAEVHRCANEVMSGHHESHSASIVRLTDFCEIYPNSQITNQLFKSTLGEAMKCLKMGKSRPWNHACISCEGCSSTDQSQYCLLFCDAKISVNISPTWISILLVVGLIIAVLVIGGIVAFHSRKRRCRRERNQRSESKYS